MEKKDLRAFIRAKKRAMTSAQVEAASARLAEKLFQHPAYQAAKSLYGYLSYNQEVRTAAILRQAQRSLQEGLPGKRHRRAVVGIEERVRSVGFRAVQTTGCDK